MKKYWLVTFAVSAQFAQSVDLAHATDVVREQSIVEQQAAVETNLQQPVRFNKERARTYTVSERLSHHKVPGISFAVINNGKVSWAQGYGTVSASSTQAVTVKTVFQAASIAKPVTAFAVMRMKDKGEIDIHADIQAYLTSVTLDGGAQTADTRVTFKNMLDHTSGLTAGGYLGYEKGQDIPTPLQIFKGVAPATAEATVVESIPGANVSYSGAGYTLVQIALSDIFEQSFEKVMDTWVLSQVGMQNSSFAMDYPQLADVQTALGHETSGELLVGGWRVHPEQAASGLWSTPTDLAKLAIEISKAYHGESMLLSQASAREMVAPVMPEQDLSEQFGGQPAMSFIVAGEGEQFLFQHGGGNKGYRGYMVMYPVTGDGAVFMTNSDAGYSVGMEMMRAASFVYNWPNFKGQSFDRREVDFEEQAVFVGDYLFDAGWQVNIIQLDQADGIAVKFPNGDVYPLSAVQGEHAYVHEDTGVEVKFSLAAGQPKILLYNQTAYKQR